MTILTARELNAAIACGEIEATHLTTTEMQALIEAELAAWRATDIPNSIGSKEAERACAATDALLLARPTEPVAMAMLLRWIVDEGGGCDTPDQEAVLLHIASQLEAMA